MDSVMIEKLFTEKTVAVDVAAKDWEEAVRAGGKLLVAAGCAEEAYVTAMLDNIRRMGQYIVIAPGLAMPHARPEYGVKRIGMGLVRLSSPVCFGNEEYDPVDLLITFCAVDQSTHIEALAELMQIIEDEEFLAQVRSGMEKDAILDYIQSKKFIKADD